MVRKDQIAEEVLRLRALGVPAVRIANDLGIHRNTVGNIVKRTTEQEQSEELALFNEKKPSPQPVFVSPHRQDL